jgi:hypothetical protein
MAEEKKVISRQDTSPRALNMSAAFCKMVQQFAIAVNATDDEVIALCCDILFRLHVQTSAPEYTDENMITYLKDTLSNYRLNWETHKSKTATKN